MDAPKEAKWGTAESHRRLDRRLAGIHERFRGVGLDRMAGGIVETAYERMHQACDEAGLRRLAEDGERAILIFEAAHRTGGVELVHHLADEIHAGRLSPEERVVEAAIAVFKREKAEAIRSEVNAETARDEVARRAREASDARSRISRLPKRLRPPLLQQLEAVPMNGKPRDYRRAMYALGQALRAAEAAKRVQRPSS